VVELEADVPPYSMNGICDDTVSYGQAGYGHDTTDCGKMPVQHLRGRPIARHKWVAWAGTHGAGTGAGDGTGEGVAQPVEQLGDGRQRQLAIHLYPSPKPPPPIPPPAPNHSPSPLPPPPPPFPPIELGMCECSCYAENSNVDTASSKMDWDPLAMTAMASVPSENTILYSAYTVIGRGRTIEVMGKFFYTEGLVAMQSMSSKIAHIASGWKVNTSTSQSNGFFSHVDVSSISPRDECATYCVRRATANRYRYELFAMQIMEQSCSCFKMDSPRLPSDEDATGWIKQHATQSGKQSDLYLITPSRHTAHYIPTIESTLHVSIIFEDNKDWFTTVTEDASSFVNDLPACGISCATQLTTSLVAFTFYPKTNKCKCFSNDPLSIENQHKRRNSGESAGTYYHASVCSHAQPDPQESSFVWNREQGQWCPGVVSESGMGLSAINGIMYNAAESSDYGDQCKITCVGGCRFAELMVTPWSELAGALPIDPPPPPSPPKPPPVTPPPYSPRPPAGPESSHNMYRTWHPLVNEYPQDSDGDGLFEITCGVPSCNTQFPIFVGAIDQAFELAQQLDTDDTFHETLCPFECKPTLVSHALSPAEEASLKTGTGFGGFLFPGREANDTSHHHYTHIPGFSAFTESEVPGAVELDHNFGMNGITLEDCRTHMSTRGVVGAAMGVWLKTGTASYGASVAVGDCVIFLATRSHQQHTLWKSFLSFASTVTSLPHYAPIKDDAYSRRTPDDSEPCGSAHDSCVYWNEFDSLAAGPAVNSYFCRPRDDLTNVLTPVKLMEMTEVSSIHFPPPSPPSPIPPQPPSPPPPPPMVCSVSNIPTLRDGRTFANDQGYADNTQIHERFTWYNPEAYCWKWSFHGSGRTKWPPLAMHNYDWKVDSATCGHSNPTLAVNYDQIRMYNTESHNIKNEVIYPTGGYYPMCADAADNECCIANHQFQTCNTENNCNSEKVYTNRHATNCKLRCEYERRYGDDEACLPAHKSCQSTQSSHDPSTWDTMRYMETYCICGAKLGALGLNVLANWQSPPPSPPHPFPSGRRELAEKDAGIGGYMNASAQCMVDILNFKHQYLPDEHKGNPVCNYPAQHKPATAENTEPCTDLKPHECCSTDRHSEHMSRTYRNNGLGNFDKSGKDVGTDVFDQESSSTLIARDMNDDGFDDLVIGNKLFLSDGSGSFENAQHITIGSDTFRKAYAVDFDLKAYNDIAYIDDTGKAYIMRSSNTHQPVSNASFFFQGLYTIERKDQLTIRFNCVVKSHNNTNFQDNECEHIHEGMPLVITEGVDASTTCSIRYLQDLNDLRVRSFSKYACEWKSSELGINFKQQYCYSFLVRIPPYDYSLINKTDATGRMRESSRITCPKTSNDYSSTQSFKTIQFIGVKKPQSGQVPTYHYPQRIGDVDDVDVVDVAIAPVGVLGNNANVIMDACLLMRGRGIKCFEFPATDLLRYDSGTAKAVFNPLPATETLDDAIGFADIRGANKNTDIICKQGGQGTGIVINTIHCFTSQPHGIGLRSKLRVTAVSGYDLDPVCHGISYASGGAYNTTFCDWRWGTLQDIIGLATGVSFIRGSNIGVNLPFRSIVARTNAPIKITLRVETNPIILKAGFIETGRSSADRDMMTSQSSVHMIVLRANNQPIIVQARNHGVSKGQYGVTLNSSPSMAVFALGRFPVDNDGEHASPLFAVAHASHPNQLWYTPTQAADATPTELHRVTEFGESATVLAFCSLRINHKNLSSSQEIGQQVELIAAGPGRYTQIYAMTSPSDFNSVSGSIMESLAQLEQTVSNSALPDIVAVACGDFDGDGDEDIITHVVVKGGGSCAYRCHELGRFGFDENYIGESVALGNVTTSCYCGPKLGLAVASSPPPRTSPQPTSPPPPPLPPSPTPPPSPWAPPPPSPKHRPGLCVHFQTASLTSQSPPPPPASINGSPLPPAPQPPPPSPHAPPPPSPPPPSPPPLPPRNPPPPPPPKPPPSLPVPPNSPPPAPAFPPIKDTLHSRLIYFSLSDENARVMQDHAATGWQPLSLAILDSEQGYPDSALIEVRNAFIFLLFPVTLHNLTFVCSLFAGRVDAIQGLSRARVPVQYVGVEVACDNWTARCRPPRLRARGARRHARDVLPQQGVHRRPRAHRRIQGGAPTGVPSQVHGHPDRGVEPQSLAGHARCRGARPRPTVAHQRQLHYGIVSRPRPGGVFHELRSGRDHPRELPSRHRRPGAPAAADRHQRAVGSERTTGHTR